MTIFAVTVGEMFYLWRSLRSHKVYKCKNVVVVAIATFATLALYKHYSRGSLFRVLGCCPVIPTFATLALYKYCSRGSLFRVLGLPQENWDIITPHV